MYREFKSLLAPEKYLTCILDSKLRKMLIKFRCGLLRLRLNEGRWLNVDISERICPLCKLGIESEYHFLFVCPEYCTLRSKYLPYVYQTQPNFHKFKSLLSSNNEIVIRNLCIYINAYTVREDRLK